MLHDCCWLIGAIRRGKLTLVRSRCSDAIYSKPHSGIWIPEFLLFFQYAIQLIWYIMVIINHLLWWFIKFLSYLYLYITKYNIYAWHEHLFEHPRGFGIRGSDCIGPINVSAFNLKLSEFRKYFPNIPCWLFKKSRK